MSVWRWALTLSTLFCTLAQDEVCTNSGADSACTDGGAISSDPRVFLKVIKDIKVPGVFAESTVTKYNVTLYIGKDETQSVETIHRRYKEVRQLKDALALEQFHGVFPSPHTIPDAVRCAFRTLESCVEDRRSGFEKWLNAVVNYVNTEPDKTTSEQATLLQSFFIEVKENPAEKRDVLEAQEKDFDAFLEAADKEATEQDDIVRKWRKADVEKRGGECKMTVNSNSSSLSEWVKSPEFLALEPYCPNYGTLFGWWGNVGCPGSLKALADSIGKTKCKEAAGGKGGIPPFICEEFVMKVAKEEEVDPIYSLLYTLEQKQLPTDKLNTLLLPVCGFIEVNQLDDTGNLITDATGKPMATHFSISPNLGLKRSEIEKAKKANRSVGRFDLKGNWGHGERRAKEDDFTLKDMNFRNRFPNSLDIMGFQPNHGISIAELVIRDSQILADLEHLDYSILADVMELPEGAAELQKIQQMHRNIPLAWAVHNGKTYAVAFGLIDLFMRWDKASLKDYWGATGVKMMNVITCRASDYDPIKPEYYRVRFARMIGYNDPGPGDHAQDAKDFILGKLDLSKQCGACYYRGIDVRFKRIMVGDQAVAYTYFKSDFQEEGHKKDKCVWSPF